jgi:hypothetical protein
VIMALLGIVKEFLPRRIHCNSSRAGRGQLGPSSLRARLRLGRPTFPRRGGLVLSRVSRGHSLSAWEIQTIRVRNAKEPTARNAKRRRLGKSGKSQMQVRSAKGPTHRRRARRRSRTDYRTTGPRTTGLPRSRTQFAFGVLKRFSLLKQSVVSSFCGQFSRVFV